MQEFLVHIKMLAWLFNIDLLLELFVSLKKVIMKYLVNRKMLL